MKKFIALFAIISIAIFSPSVTWAAGGGGLENASFSAKQLSFGGAITATPDEPAAISYNPAGIADLPGIQVQSNANFISMTIFKDNETLGSTRSSGTLVLVPTGYVTINPGKVFGDRVTFGVGSDSPFGLMNKYDSTDPATHYTGWRNYLKMYTIKPTVAVKITDWLNIGGGPMWYRVYDFGGIQAYPSVAGGGTTDGQIRINTSGNHWGWQMGALIKIKEKHRLGYYFRSPVVVGLKGRVKVENSTTPLTAGNFETGVHTKLAFPMNMTWAYAYQPTPKTHYEADFTWSRWSTLNRLYFVADPSGNMFDDMVLNAIRSADKDWQDAFGIQLAVSHKLTDKLTLRGGSFFYWTPIPKDHFTPSIPDTNHLAISVGLGYEINKHLTADLSYYNSFYFKRRINNDISEGLGTSVDGKYSAYCQAFTISLTLKWDDVFAKVYKEEPDSIAMNPAAV